jgi:methenyltetrahydrofolate cyclohydrolase
MPRSTDDQVRERKEALGRASIGATEEPLAAARAMVVALELGLRLAPMVKRSVASDVAAGADLLAGATAAVLRNVDVNLASIPDGRDRAGFEGERRRLELEAIQLRERVRIALGTA